MSEDPGFIANLKRGILLRDTGRFTQAVEFFQNAIQADSNDSRAYYHLAVCYLRMGHLFWALRFLHRAQELDPAIPEYLVLEAWILCDFPFGPRKALVILDRALQLTPNLASAFVARAHLFRVQGKWSKCEAAAREALALDPTNDFASNFLALALRKRGKTEESRQLISEILQRLPEDSFSRANAGWSALQTGDYERAHEHFIFALVRNPHEILALAGLPHVMFHRAWTYRTYLGMKHFFQRRRWYSQVLILLFMIPIVLIVLPVTMLMACFSRSDIACETTLILFSILVFILCSGGVARLYILSQPQLRLGLDVGDVFSFVTSVAVLGILAVLFVLNHEWLPLLTLAALAASLALSIGNPGAFPKPPAS